MQYVFLILAFTGLSAGVKEETKGSGDLCAILEIKKPFALLGKPMNKAAQSSYDECTATMDDIIAQWKEYEVVEKVIRSYGIKTVEELKTAADLFKSNSWTSSSVTSITQLLVDTQKNSIPFLKETLGTAKAEWWTQVLEYRSINLKPILEQIVTDKTCYNTFEIYLEWIKSNDGKKCDEASLVAISKFGSSREAKKLDKNGFFKIFEMTSYTVGQEKSKNWLPIPLESVLGEPFMKNADLQDIEFVLQWYYPIAKIKKVVFCKHRDFNLEEVIENLKKLTTDQEREWTVRAYRGAVSIQLKMTTLETILKQAEEKKVEKMHVLMFIHALEPSRLRIESDRDEIYFKKLVFNAISLESEYTQFKKEQLDIYDYIRQCTAESLSIEFMDTFLVAAKERGVSLKMFEPFLRAVCPALRYSRDENKLMRVLGLFADLSLFESNALIYILNRHQDRKGLIQAYDFVTIRSVLGASSELGIKAYFKNEKIYYCSENVVKAIIKYGVQQCKSESDYQLIYDIACREKIYTDQIVEEIDKNLKAKTTLNLMKSNLETRIQYEHRPSQAKAKKIYGV